MYDIGDIITSLDDLHWGVDPQEDRSIRMATLKVILFFYKRTSS
ncbi:MAG: hypothetical protein PVH92_02920 [Anaerolineales bacterium]